jgi:hypothetical protein
MLLSPAHVQGNGTLPPVAPTDYLLQGLLAGLQRVAAPGSSSSMQDTSRLASTGPSSSSPGRQVMGIDFTAAAERGGAPALLPGGETATPLLGPLAQQLQNDQQHRPRPTGALTWDGLILC